MWAKIHLNNVPCDGKGFPQPTHTPKWGISTPVFSELLRRNTSLQRSCIEELLDELEKIDSLQESSEQAFAALAASLAHAPPPPSCAQPSEAPVALREAEERLTETLNDLGETQRRLKDAEDALSSARSAHAAEVVALRREHDESLAELMRQVETLTKSMEEEQGR